MCGVIIPRFVLHLDVEITTNALTLWGIFGRRKEIHDMIMELHDQGYLDKDIATILNDRDILTPRNKVWFAKMFGLQEITFVKDRNERHKPVGKLPEYFVNFKPVHDQSSERFFDYK